MPGLFVALLLVSSFVLVHLWLRRRPMPKDYPLNVDEGLPLPELAQSSTVFSLTALFGAYFGVALALGLFALLGLAFGTVLGLFIVAYWINTRYWMTTQGEKSFEGFLSGVLKGNETNVLVYAFVISIVQCAYAASELLIFRELAKAGLGLKYQQATLLAILVAIMGYFYVLRGGYLAVFRTDVIQLGLVIIMALISGAILLRHSSVDWSSKLWHQPGFWEIPYLGTSRLLHFIIAAVMGLSFMLASPDTWKRVFQVLKRETGPGLRALSLAGAGTLPYVVLLPFALAISLRTDDHVKPGFMVSSSLSGNWVFTAAALGLVASFLSSFNSAMLAGAHVQLIVYRNKRSVKSERLRFYWIMIAVLFVIWLLFESGIRFSNPWLLGNFLMGAYAAIAGIQAGTRGDISRLPQYSLFLIFAIGMSGWVMYFGSQLDMLRTPTIKSVNTVPAGVIVFVGIASLCLLATALGGLKRVHRS
jgi:hypothetical protein